MRVIAQIRPDTLDRLHALLVVTIWTSTTSRPASTA
jgi:hypothetical protein